MIGETMPRLADQVAFYQQVIDAAGDKPVVFRTLDLGGDKILPYGRWEREENPALGWRALRIALDRPALLRYQVRALLAASADRVLRLLLPLVTDVDEFNRRRGLVDRELERARLLPLPMPRDPQVGLKGDHRFRGSAMRPQRSQSAHAAIRIRGRAGDRAQSIEAAVSEFFRGVAFCRRLAHFPRPSPIKGICKCVFSLRSRYR